jgi:hypothetical protein
MSQKSGWRFLRLQLPVACQDGANERRPPERDGVRGLLTGRSAGGGAPSLQILVSVNPTSCCESRIQAAILACGVPRVWVSQIVGLHHPPD